MEYLITGAAGFIGFHTALKLLDAEIEVVGIDNLNDYYDPDLKKDRLKILKKNTGFSFYKTDVADYAAMKDIFRSHHFDKVCHLAAQAGVRYSLSHPFVYQNTNSLGFLNILELMRNCQVQNLVYASSSSIYGGIKELPFSEDVKINKPISLYAATKAANELYAHVYHHLYDLNTVGLRFFTVYGPWGRPDMALFLFTDAIMNNKPIKVFNYGKMERDFTYIDDIVSGITTSLERVEELGYENINLGCSDKVKLMDFIQTIEDKLGKTAKKQMLPIQPGDVEKTFADTSKAKKLLGYQPETKIKQGINRFINWYQDYYSC